MTALLVPLVAPLVDLNPFHWLGDRVKEGLSDAFTSMMMSLWSAGLWLIDMVFGVIDKFTTPNVADPGLGHLYGVTLWLSFLVALVIGFGQIGVAAIRRDGRSLGSLAVGVVQYGAVVSGWVAICAGLILGCAGLTRGLLHTMLNVNTFAGYTASAGMTNHVTGTVQSAVLGVCSLFLLIPAAFGYLLIMLVREAGLMILTATMPIAAAGALGEGTKAWMWKSIRWFTATSLTAPLLALVVGIGVQISRAAFPDGPAAHDPNLTGGLTAGLTTVAHRQVADSSTNVGMAVVGCVIFFIACFCPMVLFRLLAFVDPGTSSGASFRTTMAANGGVSGLVSGKRGSHDAGSGAATDLSSDGRAASEDSADSETANRFQSKFTHAFGAVGKAAGGAMGAVGKVAATGASMTVDVMGQAGIGNQGYYDTTPPPRGGKSPQARTRVASGWDAHHGTHHGAAHDPAHLSSIGPGEHSEHGDHGGSADFAGEIEEGGAFLA